MLASKLRSIEESNEKIKELSENLPQEYKQTIDDELVESDYVIEEQKKAIEELEDNTYLKLATQGVKSIRESAKELYREKHRGLRFLYPKKKDEEYNKKVDELSELIPAGMMQTTGWRSMHSLYASLIVIAIAIGGGYAIESSTLHQGNNEALDFLVKSIVKGTGRLLPLAGVLTSMAFYSDYERDYGKKDAQYLDNKLEELGMIKR